MLKTKLKSLLLKSEFLSLTLIILLSISFGIANPAFFDIINIFDLLKMCVKPGLFACGVMVVLISNGIDMSFLWIGMFAAYSTSKMLSILQSDYGIILPFLAVALISMAIGAILGSFNALLVSKFEIPVFIATISSANIFMGIMFRFIGSEYIFPEKMPGKMIEFSNTLLFTRSSPDGTPVGLHVSVLITAAVFIILHFILRHTMFGRMIYALGGDSVSAQRVGFKLERSRLLIFMFSGLIAGLAGVVAVSNIQVANPYDFQGGELTVLAAVVIGGTKISGGGGSVIGVALGVLLTNIISQNLILIGIQPEYSRFVFGVLIIAATIVQAIQDKIRAR